MDLRTWASRILNGERLQEDKLFFPEDGLSDAIVGDALPAPHPPARTAALALNHAAETTPLPGPEALRDPATRARLLHAFANHELLALELMALALLRFPDAPPAWRMGTARVMADEQRHLRMYIGQIQRLGGTFGDHPLNGFFWRALSTADSPRRFTAQLGLVLEQANLDWCTLWADRFADAGDHRSAAVIRQVHADEIGHVAHAARFHRAWLGDGESEWSSFVDLTPPPLGAGRARGPVFDRAGRQAAGLSPDFIHQVEFLGQSKGRPPNVWLFDPSVEASLAVGPDFHPPAPLLAMQRDLAALPAVLATRGDVIQVAEVPATDWKAHRATSGLPPVEFAVEMPDSDRLIDQLCPWGWSPRTRSTLAPLGTGPDYAPHVHRKDWQTPLLARLTATLDNPWCAPSEDLPVVCHSAEGAREVLAAIWRRGVDAAVLKAPFGAAGQGSIRWRASEPPERHRGWLRRVLQSQGAVVVGPWLDRCMDLSFHGDVDGDGTTTWRGSLTFHADARGVFRSTRLGRAARPTDPVLRRFLAGDGADPRWLNRAGQALITDVGTALAAEGYRGPIGVDAFVYRSADGLRLFAASEINPRWTMGRVGLALEKRLAPTAHGAWHLIPRSQWGPTPPTMLAPERSADGRLQSGVLWTTDPRTAAVMRSALLVAPTADALAVLEDTVLRPKR